MSKAEKKVKQSVTLKTLIVSVCSGLQEKQNQIKVLQINLSWRPDLGNPLGCQV